MNSQVPVPVGTLITFQTGCYSDKTWHGPFKVVREFIRDDVAAEFLRQWIAPSVWEERPEPEQFLAWMQRAGYIDPVDGTTEWHIGDFNRFEPE